MYLVCMHKDKGDTAHQVNVLPPPLFDLLVWRLLHDEALQIR